MHARRPGARLGEGHWLSALLLALALLPTCDPSGKTIAAADALLAQGKGAEAEARFREAIGKDPKKAESRLGLGRALQAQGKHADALAQFRTLLEPPFEPTPEVAAEARYWMGECHLAIGRAALAADKAQSALEALTKAEQLAPSPEVDAALGDALARLGRHDDAAAKLAKAVEASDEPQLRTFVRLAEVHLARGKSDEAEAALARAVVAYPKELDLYRRLARLKLQAKKRDEAVDVLQAYLAHDPKEASVYTTLLGLLDPRKAAERRGALLAAWRKADPRPAPRHACSKATRWANGARKKPWRRCASAWRRSSRRMRSTRRSSMSCGAQEPAPVPTRSTPSSTRSWRSTRIGSCCST
ncbi:MAG: tetratricopeptide repeat protein [Deltaproteobacteria bacterium]|nr:tetratricopeptide repeat protein [Deltaproteobacteria bacterium]